MALPFGQHAQAGQRAGAGGLRPLHVVGAKVAEVLDFSPVLNQEQLWLADELRKSVFSYKISLLKAMLPSLLNLLANPHNPFCLQFLNCQKI